MCFKTINFFYQFAPNESYFTTLKPARLPLFLQTKNLMVEHQKTRNPCLVFESARGFKAPGSKIS